MKYILTFIFLLFSSFCIEAQVNSNEVKQRIDSLKTALTSSKDSNKADLFNELSWQLRNVNIDSSIYYASQGLAISKNLEYLNGINHALNYLGIAQRNRSNYSKALDYFFKALRSSEISKDLKEVSYSLINIGNIYIHQTNYDGAIEYFQRALENAMIIDDLDIIAYCHVNLGRSYVGLEQYAAAEQHIHKAQSIRKEKGDLEGMVISNVDLADLYVRQNRIEEGLNLLMSNLTNIKKLNHINTLSFSYINIAKIYLLKNDLPNAKAYIELCLDITQAHGLKNNESQALSLLSGIYESSHNYKKALSYFKAHIKKKDSIFNEESTRKIESLHSKYQAEKEEAKTKHLEEQGYLNQIIIKRQKVIILLSIVACILFLTVALVAFWSSNERRKLNAQIQKQKNATYKHNNDLIDINNEKNNLIRILSHDLRAPIHNIKGLTQVHQMEHEEDFSEQENQTLNLIKSESDRLLNMISKILNVEAINIENSEIKAEVIDSVKTINDVVEEFTLMAKNKKIILHKKFSNEKIMMTGDAVHLHQIFENLLSNALKFSSTNKNIHLEVDDSTDKIRIKVADEGPGMTEDDKTKLFKKFQTLSAKPTANEESTGLGLSIVKQYVDQMNGTIECESEVGKGTCFVLTFNKA